MDPDLALLDRAAALTASDAAAALSLLPWLAPALEADAAAGRFARWGASTVIDENVGDAVLSRPLFEALHERAGLASAWPVGNAGLLHVYGYLLSTTPTPYGLKRERWLDGTLAQRCGLPADAFLPWTGPRTLLDRVSEAASRLLAEHTVRTEEVDGRSASIAIATGASGVGALAYALDGRLITIFPIADAPAVLDGLGAPRLRWNAAP